jgi:hypothetical protein
MPCSPLKFNLRFGCFLSADFLVGSFLDSENEAIFSSEILVNFQWTTRRHILEDRTDRPVIGIALLFLYVGLCNSTGPNLITL